MGSPKKKDNDTCFFRLFLPLWQLAKESPWITRCPLLPGKSCTCITSAADCCNAGDDWLLRMFASFTWEPSSQQRTRHPELGILGKGRPKNAIVCIAQRNHRFWRCNQNNQYYLGNKIHWLESLNHGNETQGNRSVAEKKSTMQKRKGRFTSELAGEQFRLRHLTG